MKINITSENSSLIQSPLPAKRSNPHSPHYYYYYFISNWPQTGGKSPTLFLKKC